MEKLEIENGLAVRTVSKEHPFIDENETSELGHLGGLRGDSSCRAVRNRDDL